MSLTPEQETELVTNVATILEKVEGIEGKISGHDDTLYGNGKDGLVLTVDRLKIERDRTKKQFMLIWPIGLTLIARAVFDWLKRK